MIKFINRKKELETFKETFKEISGKNLVIIYGNTGVGKSELVKQFLLNYRKYPAIKVPISHKNEYNAGYYLGKIKHYSNQPINDIKFHISEDKYILKKNQYILPLKFIFNIIECIPVIKDLFQILSHSYEDYRNTKQTLKDSSGKNNIVQIEEYLNCLYRDTPFILNIENIQAIDEISWNSLYNILWNAQNYSLILEYTPNTECTIEISTILKKYENIIERSHIKLIEIKQLKNEHVIDIYPMLSACQKNELGKQLYNWNGNLKDVENFLYMKKYKQDLNISESTKLIIESLERETLEWLIKIYLSTEEFSANQLIKIGLPNETLNILKQNHLIKFENNIIIIDHDSISHLLDKDKFFCLKNNAISFWNNYYKKQYELKQDMHSIYQILHFTILQENIDSLNEWLILLKKFIISAADPVEYIKRIEKIYYKNIIRKQNTLTTDTLLFWLTELYQNLGDYKKAYSLLENITDKTSNKFLVLKALLLYQTGFQENAVTYCTKLIMKKEISEHMELFFRIIRLEANYTLENYVETQKDYFYISKNSDRFEHYLEYGFFLRNAELVKEPQEALNGFRQSIQHFEKFHADKQAVSSRLNLGVCYALLGEFEQAKEQFMIADSKKENFVGLYDMILNNQAVIMQYKGELELIKEKLLLAQKYSFYDFNQLAICINLLVYNIRMRIEDSILIEKILFLIGNRTFKNKRIVCYAYINLYNYYKDKNEALSQEYYEKIFEFSPLPYYIYEWISEPSLQKDDPEYYRTRIKWPINFLNEWSIEFDSSLMHF